MDEWIVEVEETYPCHSAMNGMCHEKVDYWSTVAILDVCQKYHAAAAEMLKSVFASFTTFNGHLHLRK